MSTTAVTSLPLTETLVPADDAALAEAVRSAYDSRSAVYPIGGGTSLDFGLPAKRDGLGLDVTGLSQVVDYTPRDMTIVVQAGARLADVAATLAEENQQLPLDVPQAAAATIGGAVAANWTGPRRFGYGTWRDYVIGISAVDGRGVRFKGGGRVVKNVAGYDFCKLLTGSLGTLGVITKVTFKVKPLAETAAAVVCGCADWHQANELVERLLAAPAPPAAIDLFSGPAWPAAGLVPENPRNVAWLAVRVEGSAEDAAWLREHVADVYHAAGGRDVQTLDHAEADALLAAEVAFPDRGVVATTEEATPNLADAERPPLELKITLRSSGVTAMMADLAALDPGASLLANAASGVIFCRFARFEADDLTRQLVGRLRPAAVKQGGGIVVLRSRFEGLTPHVVWGGRVAASPLMERIKESFDPRGILNPGRFVI